MPDDPKPTPKSDNDWMVEALEEEERSEHGLPPEPPAEEVRPASAPSSPRAG